MMNISNSASTMPQTERIRRTLTRRITLMVMLAFLIMGVIAALGVRASGRASLENEHLNVLTPLNQEITDLWQTAQQDARFLATSSITREFAGLTLQANVANVSIPLEAAQQQLIQTLIGLVERERGLYLAARYLTASGQVWTEVTNYPEDSAIRINTSLTAESQPEPEMFVAGLSTPINEVINSPLLFRRYPFDDREQLYEPLTPFFRLVSPVDPRGDLMSVSGMIQIDVAAEPFLNLVTQLANDPTLYTNNLARRLILIDQSQSLLVDSELVSANIIRRLANNIGLPLEQQLPSVAGRLSGEASAVRAEVISGLLTTSIPLPIAANGNNWQLILVDDLDAALDTADLNALLVLAALSILGTGVSFGIHRLLQRGMQPIESAGRLARQIANTDATTAAMPTSTAAGGEGEFVQAFEALRGQVQDLSQTLEARTERYQRNVETAARISRETATLRDIDTLLNRTIELICTEFGFYHAQIFLVDDVNRHAILRYSRGEAGQKLLAQGHRLAVGSQSIIGQVTAQGQALMVNDTVVTGNLPHRFNPLLPQTRAELALPMFISSRVIGALDIQSDQVDAFREEEIQVFQLLADQIGIAIENARLTTETETRIQQMDQLNRQFTRSSWQNLVETGEVNPQYTYDLLEVQNEAPASEDGYRIPITVRGVVVGEISADSEDGDLLTGGDQAFLRAIADRVGLAIEGARLLGETQNTLTETFVLYQLSRALSDANNLQDIVQAIIDSVTPDATGGQVLIFASSEEDVEASLTVLAEWYPDGVDRLLGQQLRVADHPLLAAMNAEQVVLVEDVARDNRIDKKLRHLVLNTLQAQATVLVPFSVRGIWRGILMLNYASPRVFDMREGRLYNALIDQAGVAIDNRLLLTQNELALAQIERLYGGSRIVNTAQSARDVLRAAVVANNDMSIGFELAVLEGSLGKSGYASGMHIIARTQGIEVVSMDEVLAFQVSEHSLIRKRQALNISTTSNDEGRQDFTHYMLRRRYQFGIVFPLFSANQLIALFMIVSEENVQLSPEDLEIYRALSGQMSTVLQNRRLLEQTASALDETRRLYDTSREIAAADDAEKVFAAAAQNLATANPTISRISVLQTMGSTTYDAPFVEMAYIWSRNPRFNSDLKPGMRISVDQVPFGRMFNAYGLTLRYDDIAVELPELGLHGLQSVLERNSSRSAMIFALQTRSKWLGLILLESDQVGAFPVQTVAFAQSVTDQTGIALESLLSFADAQLEARRALALAEAGQLASRMGADIAESLQEVFLSVAIVANYQTWQLVTLNEEGTALTEVTALLPEAGAHHQTRYELNRDRHSLLDAFRSKRAIIINRPATYPAFEPYAEEASSAYGKHIAVPLLQSGRAVGALMLGRAIHQRDLNEQDEQLAQTLATQVAIALENRHLLKTTETERETLKTILDTLPVGILVLDAASLRPLQQNNQASHLLGRTIKEEDAFDIAGFGLYRTGTQILYPEAELPIYAAIASGRQEFCDDVTAVRSDGTQIDMLVNAAPLFDSQGRIIAIITAFQEISTLRNLENTLQENLRNTIMLYETTRALAEAPQTDDVLDLLLMQLSMQEAQDVYLLLEDAETATLQLRRTLSGEEEFPLPSQLLDATQSLFVSDTTDPYQMRDEALRELLSARGIGAVAVLPLRARFRVGAPMGYAVLTYAQSQMFSLEREQSITTLVENAAVALDNRYLFQSTEQALAQTASLYRATTTVSTAQDQQELAAALQDAIAWLQPDRYAVYMNDNGQYLPLVHVATNEDAAATDFDALLQHFAPRNNEPLVIVDTQTQAGQSPLESAITALNDVASIALVPLRLQGRVAGAIIVAYQQIHRFSEEDVRYLSSIADSASIVADNITLLEQIQNTLTETSMLYLASRDLNDASTVSDILNVVVEHILDRAVDAVYIMLLNGESPDAPDARLRAEARWTPEEGIVSDLDSLTFQANTFAAWEAFNARDIIMIDDVERDERVTAAAADLLNMDMRAISLLPLNTVGRSTGVIVIASNIAYTHTNRDERVYRAFARQASLRLEASRLFEQTERRARQLATSARVSQLASTLDELSNLLPTMVDLIRDSFGYDHAQIFLMDEEERFAVLRASTGEAGQQLLSIEHKLAKGSKSVIGRVTEQGSPVLVADTQAANTTHRPNPYLPNTRSELAVPLILKDTIIGALDVQSNQAYFFSQEDIEVLTTLAAQISVAIDNATLYEKSEGRAKEMFFLFTVATAAAGSDTLSETLHSVVTTLQEQLNAAAVTLYLPRMLSDGTQTFVELHPAALAGAEMPLTEISEVRLDTADNLLARAAIERRPYLLQNLRRESRYIPIMGSARSALLVPLMFGSKLVSVIAIESNELNAYDNDTQTLLLTLSGTLAATLQNQQLVGELQETNEQLLELDRLKSDFLANMSHELRTPLNSIIGFSRVILKGIDGPLTELQEQDLSTIYNSGQHLLNLINDILDQAKIAAGKMDIQTEYFDIKPVIDGVRSIGIGLVRDKPIEILVHTAPALPRAYGDEFRIRQVLLNLVSNAAKFTREGTITINTYQTQDAETQRDMLCIEVVDTGIGIAAKDLPLLFEAFRQVDSSLTKTHAGTGLGLPIAKSLIEMQEGRMTVQSQVNVGSTFAIYIPIAPLPEKPTDTHEAPEVEAPPTNGPTGQLDASQLPPHVLAQLEAIRSNGDTQQGKGNGKGNHPAEPPAPVVLEPVTAPARRLLHVKRQILLIEDNPDLVDQFRRVLQREGFDVFAASMPLEAEAMASGLRPTLIVLDLNFANDAGWSILEHLQQRDDTIDIPIIAAALGDEAARATALGAFRFVRKPFMPEDLAEAARTAEKEANISKVLIIDDDPNSTRLLEQVLGDTGKYRVFSAQSGIEGMALIARRRPDLVIVDLRMPEMDGIAVIKELRANPEVGDTPVMVVTGDTLNPEETLELSQLRVIYKPDIAIEGAKVFIDTVKDQLSPQGR
jgi:GAF domain-containing protein/DNA-binding response OmpR family regulator